MPRRSSRTPLYELLARGRDKGFQHETVEEYEPEIEDSYDEPVETGPHWLSPGRLIHLPVGYLLLASAGVMLVLVIAFIFGHRRGEMVARAEFDTAIADKVQGEQLSRRTRDPLLDITYQAKPSGPATANGAASIGLAESSNQSTTATTWGPVESDPRQAGLNYFVLMHTTQNSAIDFAGFCRDHGLEAYAVRVHNQRLWRVFVLPGYAAGDGGTSRIQALRQAISRVEDRWRIEQNLREDYTLGYYADKFEG